MSNQPNSQTTIRRRPDGLTLASTKDNYPLVDFINKAVRVIASTSDLTGTYAADVEGAVGRAPRVNVVARLDVAPHALNSSFPQGALLLVSQVTRLIVRSHREEVPAYISQHTIEGDTLVVLLQNSWLPTGLGLLDLVAYGIAEAKSLAYPCDLKFAVPLRNVSSGTVRNAFCVYALDQHTTESTNGR